MRLNLEKGGEVRIDFAALDERREFIKKQNKNQDMKYVVGYDPLAKDAPENQDNAFQAYLDVRTEIGKTVPFIQGGRKRWDGKSSQDFLEKTGLMRTIEYIAKYPPMHGGNAVGATGKR